MSTRSGLRRLVLLLLLLLVGCRSTQNGAALAPVDSPMVFRVGEMTVTEAEFRAYLERQLGPMIQQQLAQGIAPTEINAQATADAWQQTLFDRMIQDEMLLLIARQEGVGVDPGAVDEIVEDQATFAQTVGETADMPTDTSALRVQMAREQLMLEVVARHTHADMFRARHLLVATREQAEQIVADLAAGASFAALAREHSPNPRTAERAANPGWNARGIFPPEFDQAVFAAELNRPVIVESSVGYYVIEVLERQDDRPFENFAQLRGNPNIQNLYRDTFLPWYEQVRTAAEANGILEINPDFDPASVPLPFPDAP